MHLYHKVLPNYLLNYFEHVVCVLCCSRVPQGQLAPLERMAPVATQVQSVLPAPAVPEAKAALP